MRKWNQKNSFLDATFVWLFFRFSLSSLDSLYFSRVQQFELFLCFDGPKVKMRLHENFQRNEKKRSSLNYKETQRRTKQMKKTGQTHKKSDNFFSSSKIEPEEWKMERILYQNVHGRTERRTNNGTTELYMSNSSSFRSNRISFFLFSNLDFKSIWNFRHCVYHRTK